MAEEKPSVDASTQAVEEHEPSTSAKTEQALKDEQDLKVWANEQGGANLPLLTPPGDYFYLY